MSNNVKTHQKTKHPVHAQTQGSSVFSHFLSGIHQTLNQANVDVFNATNRLIEEDPDMTTEQRIKALWENSAKFREQTAETVYTVLKITVCVTVIGVACKNPDTIKDVWKSLKNAA